jgi:xanthine dehydrogenase accessory factor
VVVVTHDEKLDVPALQAALAGPARYVGLLGSAATQAARSHRLAEAGVPRADLGRIHGPIGLELGAVTPPEIAVSILAELVAVRRIGDPKR